MSAIDNFDSYVSSRNSDGSSKLQRLRYHLASEGCSDSQLSLAKSFLHDAAETDTERKENSELAVRWLLLASSEGNQEAFQLLENCYKMGVGVTYANREHIESCLRSTTQEKLAQRVGSNLFRLIAYDTQECIPLEYFQKRIKIYLKDEDVTEQHNLSWDSKTYCSTYISAQDVVSSVHDCLLGNCPEIKIDPEPFDFIAVQDFNCNVTYGKYMFSRILKIGTKAFDDCCLQMAELNLCLMLFSFVICILSFCNFRVFQYFVLHQETFIVFLECVVGYKSSLLILVTSARLVQYEMNLTNIQKWKKIISKCDSKALASIPRYSKFKYTSNLVLFTLGVILFIMCNDRVSCLALFGTCILISVFYIKTNMKEMHIAPSILLILNFILALTRLNSKVTSFPFTEVATFPTVPVTNQELVIRSTAILSVFTVIMFLIVICKYNLVFSLSFLMKSAWLHILTESFLRIDNLTCVTFFLFVIPFVQKLGIHVTIFLVYFISQIGFQTDYPMLIFMCSIPIFLSIITELIRYIKKTLSLSWYHIYAVLIIVVFSLAAQQLPFINNLSFVGHKNVTWNYYSKLCHRPAWTESNMVHTQLNCDKFQGQTLIFEANVNNVRRSSHHLAFPEVLNFNFLDLNVNSYEIMLEIKGTFRIEATLQLLTDDRCKDFVLELRAGDLLSVIGTFESGLGTDKLRLTLEDAHCISCMDDIKCHIKDFGWYQIAISKFSKVVAFFLYPWIK